MNEGKGNKLILIVLGIVVVVSLVIGAFFLGRNSVKEDKNEDIENLTDFMNSEIEKAEESARVRSVEAYIGAIESEAVTYMTLNPDVVVTDDFICTGISVADDAKCLIDATVAANKSNDKEGINANNKVVRYVKYSGSDVVCESALYDADTLEVTVTNCTVGEDTQYVYSGNYKEGIKRVN